jgi:two-component system chemotaxis sensor kinase CheA
MQNESSILPSDPALPDVLAQLAAVTSVGLDENDLGQLAALHTQFQQVRDQVMQSTHACKPQLAGLATSSEQLIERLILNEVDDARAAVEQVIRSVAQLQQLVDGRGDASAAAAPVSAPASAPSPVEPAKPAHAPAAIDAESAISADDASLAVEFITEATGHLESAEANLLKLEESRDPETINAIFRSFHTIKGVAGFLNLKQIGALAHAAENLLDLARKGKVEIVGTNVDIVLESIDQLKALLVALQNALGTGEAIAAQPALPGLISRLHAAAAGESTTAAKAEAPATVAPDVQSAPENALDAKGPGSARGVTSEATVKVATDRLDSLINTVGELVIAQSMVSQDVLALSAGSQRVQRNVAHLSKIARELQELSMSMRMVPIQGVFQKMARLARDTARKAGKEIDFQMVGGETELDRNVVEAISDPLVHMVRNSVDHGVEPADKRVAQGKSRAGLVQLKAYHEAGNIVIEITDDGRGLNKQRLVEKAIAAGIVQPGEQLADQEIFKLVFHPGLSTAEKITDISGRGVGMDVVKRNVEALRGRIDIASSEGKGSTFTIRLPLTLAVIDGLVVRIGQHRYIIPILTVEQSLRPTSAQISTIQGRGEMCSLRGRLLPLYRLYRLFGVTPTTEDPTQALVVIVQDDDRRACLLVDELVGQQQVVIKSLGESLGTVQGVSGGAILGDGSISLILDVAGLIKMAMAGE